MGFFFFWRRRAVTAPPVDTSGRIIAVMSVRGAAPIAVSSAKVGRS